MAKILWATPNTLLDTTNGAALSVKEMLTQLSYSGFEVKILGCTIVTHPNGMAYLEPYKDELSKNIGKFISITDSNLEHRLLVTQNINRRTMLSYEEKGWFEEYCNTLDHFKPDFVLFFDDSLLSYLTADEAKTRGINTVAYLAHPNVVGQRWKRDVDLILTDSYATAQFYKSSQNYDMVPIGKFIPPQKYKADAYLRKNVLFVNPTLEKGAVFVVQLALFLEKKRPDIKFEIMESRSNFLELLGEVTQQSGKKRSSLSNLTITPNTHNMKPVYGRARILLVPSLWWESSGRVIVEALLNGIPVIGTKRGGIPETIGENGFFLNFSSSAYEAPYNRLFDADIVEAVGNLIEKLYDDEAYYASWCEQALASYHENHDIIKNTKRLIDALRSC